jgi:hypothetical protein
MAGVSEESKVEFGNTVQLHDSNLFRGVASHFQGHTASFVDVTLVLSVQVVERHTAVVCTEEENARLLEGR